MRAAFGGLALFKYIRNPGDTSLCSYQCLTDCFSLNSGLGAPCLGAIVRPGNGRDVLDQVTVSMTAALLCTSRNSTGTRERGLGLSNQETLQERLVWLRLCLHVCQRWPSSSMGSLEVVPSLSYAADGCLPVWVCPPQGREQLCHSEVPEGHGTMSKSTHSSLNPSFTAECSVLIQWKPERNPGKHRCRGALVCGAQTRAPAGPTANDLGLGLGPRLAMCTCLDLWE